MILVQFRQLSTVIVSDNRNYLKQMQLKMTFCVSRGSVATSFRWDGGYYTFKYV